MVNFYTKFPKTIGEITIEFGQFMGRVWESCDGSVVSKR